MDEYNTSDIIEQFRSWLEEAKNSDIEEPTAMALATVSEDHKPSVRMVLLKKFDEAGFVFYTNLHSHKAQDICDNKSVSLCFYWPKIKKQVRIDGTASLIDTKEADDYFASRPKKSQIGAWASKQSQVVENKFDLEKRVIEFGAKFSLKKIPRPEFWSGYRVTPDLFEFWHDKPFRLHDRWVYTKSSSNISWKREKLYP